ncbi:MAG: hypothetical protein KC609_08225 [Myxococcales bacterium]|nr:hypothetical protein [Myxococcales bacterium]
MRLLCAWCLLCAVANPASAYLRSTTTGVPGKGLDVFWGTRSVVIKYNSAGTNQIDGTAELFEAYRRSMATWNAVSCSDFAFVDGGSTPNSLSGLDPRTREPDRENLIVFRDDDWTHQKDLLALTTVIFSNTTGEIVDADLELNSFRYSFSVSDTDVLNDVQNTVTHELGHVLGLDHPCGNDPSCGGDDLLKETTMYQNAPVGELKKRDLAQDDIDGLCAIYPLTVEVESDSDLADATMSATSSSCHASPGAAASPLWWLVFALISSALALRANLWRDVRAAYRARYRHR